MSSSGLAAATRRGRILCLGEALVDLICERPIETLAEARTVLALVAISIDGKPSCEVYGDAVETILRGARRADAVGPGVKAISTVGAGDVLTGTLLARLALSGFYPSAVAAALDESVRAAASACQRWGALD